MDREKREGRDDSSDAMAAGSAIYLTKTGSSGFPQTVRSV